MKLENKIYRKKDKKGNLLTIWWFFVIAVIGGGIVIGVWIYYSSDININQEEADILGSRISQCLIDNGYLNEVYLEKKEIFDECKLSRAVFGQGSNFYFKVSIYEGDKLLNKIEAGNGLFEKDCIIKNKLIAKHFPRCSIKNEIAINKDKALKIIILTGVNQDGEVISGI